ncbi:tetratricopeptide repeat protein [Polluticaenibacter yanchengensis]|uniref:Tetratricopeptide repeat protein n=1 Tax=Polluticaenibacter yanchengensis TaxID=3014562 RepID=A0ABT4UEU6_9BACT|nr:tetratricopeptide repeat protein [Chitinophagaceae bacterium LY-5]
MMRRLLFTTVMAVGLSVGAVNAQSVNDGSKALYYNQLNKAKNIFQDLVKANPADAEANYWLGQTLLEDENVAGARAVYEKALVATSQNPLIIIGLGHVELLEGKNAEARAHFDAALEPTKSKKNKKYGDPVLLAAIGRANADGGSTVGDPAYGVEKLTQAAELLPKDPEVMVNLGLTYLKMGPENGGKAKSSFDAALERDPSYARANYRNGKIFESQKNAAMFVDHFTRAIEADAKYAPAYLSLYEYYSDKDVNKAKEYLDKWIQNVEKDTEIDFFYADYLFRAGKYQESLQKVKEIETSLKDPKDFAKVYRLQALNQDRLGDSLAAKSTMEKYLNLENPLKVPGRAYQEMAGYYIKTGEEPAKADAMITKAIDLDTAVENKIALMEGLASVYEKAKLYDGQFKWMYQASKLKQKLNATDYFYLAQAAINAQQYLTADTIAQKYIENYPDQIQGYSFRVRALTAADTDTTSGIAIPAYIQFNDFLKKDAQKNLSRILGNSGYLINYYANVSREYEKAIAVCDEILALDPQNAAALQTKELLVKRIKK